MNQKLKAEWLAALESGEYAQGRDCLARDGRFCCLGVLCAVSGLEFDGDASFLPPEIEEIAALDKNAADFLAWANDGRLSPEEAAAFGEPYKDNEGAPFTSIAQYIRKNL